MTKGARFGVFGADSKATVVGRSRDKFGYVVHYVWDHDKRLDPLNPTVHTMHERDLSKISFELS